MATKEKTPRHGRVKPASDKIKVAEAATAAYAVQLETQQPDKTDVAALLRALTDGLQYALGPEVQLLILYGSYARGEAQPESDVDLFVVLRQGSEENYDTVRQVAYQVMWDADFTYIFSLCLTDVGHYQALEEQGSSFLRNVQREGKVLWQAT